jgi:uncharacterized protein (DUF3084 family)
MEVQMDGTENPKGLSSEGQTSEGEAQGTSQATPRTYTEEELQKAKSDALAAAGRDAKSLSEKEATLKADREAVETEKTKIADWERRREQAEQDEARKDPDKLAAWQKKQTEKTRDAEFTKREQDVKKREQDLARREAETAETVKAAQETTLGVKVYEIAAKYDLNPEELRKDMKDLTLTTLEQLEKYAKRISTTGQRPPGDEGAKVTTAPVTVPTSGGARKDYTSIKFGTNAPSAKDMITKGLEKK